MMKVCNRCGSMAINHQCHGRDGSDPDLCDVCYWRKRAERMEWKPIGTARMDGKPMQLLYDGKLITHWMPAKGE